MKTSDTRILRERKARIEDRLDTPQEWRMDPVIERGNVRFEVAYASWWAKVGPSLVWDEGKRRFVRK